MSSAVGPRLKPVSGSQGYARIGGSMSRAEANELEQNVAAHIADLESAKGLEQRLLEADTKILRAQQGLNNAREMENTAQIISNQAKKHLEKSKDCKAKREVIDQKIQDNNVLIINNCLGTLAKIATALKSTENSAGLMIEAQELIKLAKAYEKDNMNAIVVAAELKTLHANVQSLAFKLRDLVLANKAQK